MKSIALNILSTQHSEKCKRIAVFVVVFIAACFTMKLIPAFQSPDETAHLMRADMLAHGQFFLKNQSGKPMAGDGGYVDAHFLAFAEFMQAIAGNDGDKDVKAEWRMSQAEKYGWANNTVFTKAVGTGYYAPLIYTPHAIGLGISRHLDLSLRKSYEITRMMVTLVVFLIIYWAWSILPPDMLTKALVVMPMSAFQILSPTIDGLCIALAILLFSIFFIKAEGKRETSAFEDAAFYLSIFVLMTSRVNLLPILALPLLLAARDFSARKVFSAAVLSILSIAWTIYGALSTNDTRISRSLTTIEIASIYAANPVEFIQLLFRTIADAEKMAFFAQSFVGYLGWLDAPVSPMGRNLVWGGLVLSLAISLFAKKSPAISSRERVLIACLGMASIVMVFFALAITWNDYPADLISGVQGRYFIIPALILSFSLSQARRHTAPWSRTVESVVFVALFSVSAFVLIETLQGRYGMKIF